MAQIIVEPNGNIVVVRLNNEVVNAIGPKLVDDLHAVLRRIDSKTKAVVLAGGAKFFSIGLDLPTLLKLDADAVRDFLRRFDDLLMDLLTLPVPTVCAIAGHAVAGGTILALMCDRRVASEGRKMMGLNEIQIGVPVPYIPDLVLRQTIGNGKAMELMVSGELIPTAAAREIGLVDTLCGENEVEMRAIQTAADLSKLPQMAYATIKENRVGWVRWMFERFGERSRERMVACWYDSAVRVLLEKASEKF